MSVIDDVCAYLVAAIDGASARLESEDFVIVAQDPPLPTLDTARLPNGWCLSGEATSEAVGDDGRESLETRAYRVQVATHNFGEDEPNHREQVIRALLPVAKLALRQAALAIDVTGVFQATVTGDSGPAILSEYGGNFVGFEVRLSVKEMIDP